MWDKLPTIIGALNPILLLVIGFYLNAGIEAAKLATEQNKARIEETSAKISDLKTTAETSAIVARERVDKVKVISDFLNDLSGNDERRRRLAIEAVFIALPDEAARLVKAVENINPATNDGVRNQDAAAAKSALGNARERLVAGMFSESRPLRVEALSTLERGWTDDRAIVDLLLSRAMTDVKSRAQRNWSKPADAQEQQQLASVYNTMEFLTFLRGSIDGELKPRLKAFAEAAAQNSDDTKRQAAVLLERLR